MILSNKKIKGKVDLVLKNKDGKTRLVLLGKGVDISI